MNSIQHLALENPVLITRFYQPDLTNSHSVTSSLVGLHGISNLRAAARLRTKTRLSLQRAVLREDQNRIPKQVRGDNGGTSGKSLRLEVLVIPKTTHPVIVNSFQHLGRLSENGPFSHSELVSESRF